MIDFLYDALNLRRSGLEYVTGAFHDIGKLIMAELFPFAYFTTMNRSMQDELPLVACEREIFEYRSCRNRRDCGSRKTNCPACSST